MKRVLLIVLSLVFSVQIFSQEDNSPMKVICLIGDKLVNTTPFKNRLVVSSNSDNFNNLKFVNFKRSFGQYSDAYAYALSSFIASEDSTLSVQVTHNDHCILWLNGKEVYNNKKTSKLFLSHEERSVELTDTLNLSLKKGINIFMVQLSTTGDDWSFFIQPEPEKGAVNKISKHPVFLSLKGLDNIDSSIEKLSSWLICGPFEKKQDAFHSLKDFSWGEMYYSDLCGYVTWTLPKIDILGDVISPVEWGTNYNWNYHNGGVAWAMFVLSELTGEEKYADYAKKFCDFHLKNIPFIKYQIEELNAFNCTNHHIYKTPLLDFTLAPSLPFIYALNSNMVLNDKEAYVKFVLEMLDYVRKQIRLPGMSAYTRLTPVKYTTWVDDMFMGIPFLVQAFNYTKDLSYLYDAAKQVLDYNNIVWDKESKLYVHAQYSNKSDIKMPHWSRANGWGIWAITEVLKCLDRDSDYYKLILRHYQEHVSSLVTYQNERGFWYNVIDYPESREEVSGTAIFTMAIARGIRYGWIDKKKYYPVVAKGWSAISSKVDYDGTVYDICYGTMCSPDIEYYCNRPFYKDDTHGLFAVLFAGIEVYLLENMSNN